MFRFWSSIVRLIRYNVKIVFGNKFFYFLLSALGFYLVTVAIGVFGDEEIIPGDAYTMLLLPTILLVFYPMCFGIQNDQDAKITEIIFGIPNYSYKVWLFRLLISYSISYVIALGLAFLTNWLVVEINPFSLAGQVMIPALVVGSMSFMFSTTIRSGNGTAVVVIILLFVWYILGQSLIAETRWDLFINPFEIPVNKNAEVYMGAVTSNRIVMGIATILFLLIGLNNTRRREKFI